jgi:hypothetical protein
MVCLLETPRPGCNTMQTNTIIENLVARELKALCGACVHQYECIYHKTSTKAIIQCELFKLGREHIADSDATHGLCTTCDHAHHCTLPGRRDGVWRCPDFS